MNTNSLYKARIVIKLKHNLSDQVLILMLLYNKPLLFRDFLQLQLHVNNDSV